MNLREMQPLETWKTSPKLAFGRINFFNTLIPSSNKKSNTLKKKKKHLVKPTGLFKYVYSAVTTGPYRRLYEVVPWCVFLYLVGLTL